MWCQFASLKFTAINIDALSVDYGDEKSTHKNLTTVMEHYTV